MAVHDDYQIDPKVLERCKRTFGMIEKTLGISIHVHDENDVVETGDIFLFNHFARFETAIPVYLFYRDYQKYTRSITSHHLFNVSEGFSKFLSGGGAVPNNMPGLLAFLAAEILRGRKVVIYPEGGMIKDRKVMDDKGEFRIYSDKAEAYRKHHRGAAVLALTLDIFKHRILNVFEEGDEKRITHWMRSLGIENRAELLEKAKKPTQIIPSTITFHPLRVSDNLFKKAASLFVKDLTDVALDEILVEGNIILKDTDMDIRFGKPLTTEVEWKWWEKALLRRYFESIDSLDDLFSLKNEQGNSFAERILTRFISRETRKIRNRYMRGVYSGVTVNFNHIAASLVMQMFDAGQTVIPAEIFHHKLYLIIKKLQENPDVYLHRNLVKVDLYTGLRKGVCTELEHFVTLCRQTGLMDYESGTYLLREKLNVPVDYYVVRLKNPLRVAVNEVQPVEAVAQTVADVVAQKMRQEDLSAALFDDEIRLYAQEKERYEKEIFDKVNAQEQEKEEPQPYILLPENTKHKTGVLMIHGYSATPGELKPLAENIHKKYGLPVMGVRLTGHGTSPHALCDVDEKDWLESVRRGYDILSGYVDDIVVIGFSMGGTLSLNLVENEFEKVIKIISVCAPLDVRDKNIKFTRFVNALNQLLPGRLSFMRFSGHLSSSPHLNYGPRAIHSLAALERLMRSTEKGLYRITCPVHIIQATQDRTVMPESAKRIFDRISAEIKTLDFIETTHHGILYENTGGSWELVEKYVVGEEKK